MRAEIYEVIYSYLTTDFPDDELDQAAENATDWIMQIAQENLRGFHIN